MDLKAETACRSGDAPADLEDVLATIHDAGSDAKVAVADITEAFGHRSLGALLLVPALISLIPGVGAIPGLPTVCAVVSLLVAGQILIGHDELWLPRAIRRRRIDREKLDKGMRYAVPAARFIDRFVRPRLCALTHGPFVRVIAAVCVLLSLSVPPLEVIPMAAIVPEAAIGVFGLALVARDGALAAFGLALTAATGYAIWHYLL